MSTPGVPEPQGPGVLVAVCTAGAHSGRSGIDKRPRSGSVTVGVDQLEGDVIRNRRHHGGRDQAVYAYSRTEARRWASELGREVPPGWFGENLAVDGLAVSDAVVGQRWRVGGDRPDAVVLEVTLPRTPCTTFSGWVEEPRWVRRFAARGDVGTYLRVVQPGTVSAGDVVDVVHTPAHGVTVRELFTGGDATALGRLLELGEDLPPKAVTAAQRVVARA